MTCPRCGHGEAYSITTRNTRKCKACHHQYSETSGTPFRCTKLTTGQITALLTALEGNSVREAARIAGVSYKTAWRISKMPRS